MLSLNLWISELHKEISDSIKDDLVGDGEELAEPPQPTKLENEQSDEAKESEEKTTEVIIKEDVGDHEPKSESSSSGSDHFVIVNGSGSGSEPEVIDEKVKVESDEKNDDSGKDVPSSSDEVKEEQTAAENNENESKHTENDTTNWNISILWIANSLNMRIMINTE